MAAGATHTAAGLPSLPIAPRGGAGAGPYIPSLDGLRALAFLLVFLAHSSVIKWMLHIPASVGEWGVSIFFLLSGYLITTLLRLEAEAGGGISLRHFYLRRVLRIFPPMYLCILLGLALVLLGVFPRDFSAWSVAAQCLHLHNYYVIFHCWHAPSVPIALLAGTKVLWSLAVEEHFYLVFPLAYILLRRHAPGAKRQAGLLLCVCGAALLWRLILVYGLHPSSHFRIDYASDTRLDSILFGCVLAIGCNPVLDRAGPSTPKLAGLGILALVGLLIMNRFSGVWASCRFTAEALLILPLFIAAIRYHDRGVFRLLNLQPVRFLGVLSYSLYLFHNQVQSAIAALSKRSAWHIGLLAQDVAALALSIVVAAAVHYAVERPCAKLRKRLASPSRRGPSLRYHPVPAGTQTAAPARVAA